MERNKSLIDPLHFLYWMIGYHNEVGEEIRLINGRFCFCSESEEPDPITTKDIVQLYFLHYPDKATDCATLRARNERMEKALAIIQKWQFPATGQFWDDEKTQPMSYSAAYGSNGERDFMRNVANQALKHEDQHDYPKLIPEQIQERKEAIEWIRNPDKERYDKLVDILDEARLQIEYLHKKYGETGSGNNILARISTAIDDIKGTTTS